MAGHESPAALAYLVSEGLLPANPLPELYQWECHASWDGDDEIQEEILATKDCVVWSHGQFVQNVYRFELEGEAVVQAVLTQFPTVDSIVTRFSVESSTSRALIVFLKTKAHVHFLNGSTHILDLPVEVEKAFPAPCGVIVQRKSSPTPSLPPTPQFPRAPPSSFLSPRNWQSASFLASPTVAKSFGGTPPSRSDPLASKNRLDALFQDAFGSPGEPHDEDLAPLYSLTNPLADFGVVTYSSHNLKPRLSSKSPSGMSVEFEPLSASEQVVYVSPTDELRSGTRSDSGSLMLIVTTNNELHTLTIWHAWQVQERSLASLMKQRAAQKAASARRRSSFLSASMVATGTTTPGVRQREGTRESMAAAGSIRLPSELAAPHPGPSSSRKPTRQEEEDAMASQMDPDYHPTASQQNARESRRISSMNSDVRGSQNAAHAASSVPGGRRNTSFGGYNDRRSFGHRKSRGSTPGSTFSRSLGPDDDSMDTNGDLDINGDETVEAIMRQIRAASEAAGAENIFGGGDGDLKKELVARKLHSIPLAFDHSSVGITANAIQVATLGDSLPLPESNDQRLNVYIHERATNTLTTLHFLVKHRTLNHMPGASSNVAVPLLVHESRIESCGGITKIRDKGREALLLEGQGLLFSPDDRSPSEPQINASELGKIRLRPDSGRIEKLLRVCRLVLLRQQGAKMLPLWHTAHAWLLRNPSVLQTTAADPEWLAFATTILGLVLPALDDETRSTLRSLPAEGFESVWKARLLRQQQESMLSMDAAWRWMYREEVPKGHESQRDAFLTIAASLANQLDQSTPQRAGEHSSSQIRMTGIKLMLGLHVFNEEQKLCTLNSGSSSSAFLPAIIAQLGNWLGVRPWSFSPGCYYHMEGAREERWQFVRSQMRDSSDPIPLMPEPVGITHWFERALETHSDEQYPTLDIIASLDTGPTLSGEYKTECTQSTPRIETLSGLLASTSGFAKDAATTVEAMASHLMTTEMLESMPSGIAAPFREAIARCEKEPRTTWSSSLLSLVGRDDLDTDTRAQPLPFPHSTFPALLATKDVQTVCNALDHHPHIGKTKEAKRHAVSRLIFNEDRRLVEAVSLMHYNSPQVAECPKQPDWSDAHHLEQQRKLMQWVTIRMIALPAGDGMIHFDSQTPLLTDRYHLAGFSNSCLMQPMGHTMTTDKSGLTEERVNWAYFHAGVSAGLRISRTIEGIDTSWIAFNKPNDLTNRHAGLLLALGLNGHLRNLAKWLSFKYLTPKHTMTSVGLLLGLSASYMGTMDTLITRMLSVHITRMLPPGAAELNVSPITQTAGLMGIGLLYYNTQHRRMSEIMLSEIEHMELEDPDSGPDPLRDESYRLAAGLALGFINLGKGKDLRGLHGMYLPERLLAIAVGPRPVHAVHVFDRATAGAVVAVALVYMKSGDRAMAHKIDVPDTEAQFDHVRPDVLLLRAMARHIILWDGIAVQEPSPDRPQWIYANLPKCYQVRYKSLQTRGFAHCAKSSDIPFFNIATGLAWALSLKYAGTGNVHARDEILTLLGCFPSFPGGIASEAYARAFNYDTRLTRSTLRRCMDVLAVSAATVMAGTGDLQTFRHLRRLHGRTNPDTSYGSHLASHLAIGILFMGGGTYTFGTSNLAIASLICAFYPLYPTDVQDNHVHLQAFRHLWVFAAEARCLIVEDIDTKQPISMPLLVSLKDGTTKAMTAPSLLPELDSIATVQTNDPSYWRVTLDFAANPTHLAAFKQNQRIFVRHCPASEAHTSTFSATLSALNGTDAASQSIQPANSVQQTWQSIFALPVFKELEKAELELVLPPDVHSSVYTDERETVVDDRLALVRGVEGGDRGELWNLRVLFAWAEKVRDEGDGRLKWIGSEVVDGLRARIEEKQRVIQ
ncbi:hypothetical protein BDY17DRAFT_253258 [Neohortaea acidophila]|uniref:Uncharacterized protein n=1 Tax=Neohortaea acidophila TaxID=245834 RepID=A0A6A6PQC6_9PEZI|nr:uncharacterized protein BDY17DRAFT_253258 [Neohortaea acidophila]KAF2481834.1 hypothetical protein BDY17DRAFT_253258 [Neohortaea acidophila]